MKKLVVACITAILLLMGLCSTAFAAGLSGDPYHMETITFTIEYDDPVPTPETIRIQCETPHVWYDNIRVNADQQLLSVDFHVDDGRYGLAIRKRSNIIFIPFKEATKLQFYSARRYNNTSSLRVFLTWGEVPDPIPPEWVADDYGLRHFDYISETPTVCAPGVYFNNIAFDENGYVRSANISDGWKQLGDYWCYFDHNGNLVRNQVTPDGYWVDNRGIYIEGAQTQQ